MTTVIFTEEERKYIIKEPYNWHVSEDAPKEIADIIEKKLKLLYPERSLNG